ncbi:MAG: transposase [Gammaproteobacteria bacterium]|nr:transposase [Gammaproteobacteria bacterium]
MPRKPRIHYSGAFYHVMLRGNGGEDIFFDNDDRTKFLSLINEGVNRFNFRVHGFCLMTNHVHLALQVGEIPLSNIIQNISFRYTRIMNKKRNKIGHLFQGRYKALIVDADNYLLKLIQYIHLNPVRANMVINPGDYRWSSHNAYLKLSYFSWLTTSYVLRYFSTDERDSLIGYKKFILEPFDQNAAINFNIANKKSFPAICDDVFMKKLESLQNNIEESFDLTLDQLIDSVCLFYKIEEACLYVKSRNRFNSKIRAVIAWLALEFKIGSAAMVANYFKCEHTTVTRAIKRILLTGGSHELNIIKNKIINEFCG